MITRHSSVDVGSYIRYNSNGSIAEQRDQARTVGTTVSIKNLFDVFYFLEVIIVKRLPVRRKAYLKSSKTHLSNMITLVQVVLFLFPENFSFSFSFSFFFT